MSLETSGGHYYDADEGGPIGALRRNVDSALAEVTSGRAGATAVGVTVGMVAAGYVKRVIA